MILIDDLEKIGLSKREAEIYMALLKKKEFSAPELASITTVPRTKVYDILQNLENKGLCTGTQINNRKKYSALEPKIAFDNILSNYEEELQAKRTIAEQLEQKLKPIFKEGTSEDDPLDYIEVLKDSKQINERWLSYQQNAKEEILVFTKPPYTAPFKENIDTEINTLRKNVKVKGIYEYKNIQKEELLKIIRIWRAAGEEVRLVKELPMKLVIVDKKITMFALNDPISLKPSITTMLITHPSLAKSFGYVFESIWNIAIPLEDFQLKDDE